MFCTLLSMHTLTPKPYPNLQEHEEFIVVHGNMLCLVEHIRVHALLARDIVNKSHVAGSAHTSIVMVTTLQ
jgi:hypothetical protein